MLTTYYAITATDYSNLYKYCITCSLISLVPLFYLIFIRSYFSIVATMSDDRQELRGNLDLLKNEELEISMQEKVFNYSVCWIQNDWHLWPNDSEKISQHSSNKQQQTI